MPEAHDGVAPDPLRDEWPGGAQDELTLAAQVEEITRASQWLDDLAERDGWSERARFTLQLGLEEALVNIVSYGYPQPGGEARIRLGYRHDEGMARLRIADNGIPFDPTGLADPEAPASVEEAKVGGHGVQLMRHLLDEFSYCRRDGNNLLILGRRTSASDS